MKHSGRRYTVNRPEKIREKGRDPIKGIHKVRNGSAKYRCLQGRWIMANDPDVSLPT